VTKQAPQTILVALLAVAVLAACSTTADEPLAPPPVVPVETTQIPPASPPQTPTVTLTPTPALTRLTEPGCCTLPTWSADSTQVRFIDRPASTQQVGLYAVGLDGGPPTLVSERLGKYSPDQRFMAYPEDDETYVEDVTTGQRWLIDNGGRQVFFSPSGNRLAWSKSLSGGGYDVRPEEINVTALSGTVPVESFTVFGGGYSGWLDDDHLLVAGKLDPESERVLFSLSLQDGTLVELARGERVRSGIAAPGGEWVAYIVLLDQEQPENNGIWIVSADGQQRFQLDLFGAFQWRDANHLLLVPQETTAGPPSHRLVEIDATTGQSRPLTDPLVTPFVIEGGDWQVSPDGRHVVFVSATDRAIWLLALP